MIKAQKILSLFENDKKQWGYVEIHTSGFPLRTSSPYDDRAEAAEAANRAYRAAVNTGSAGGIRFGVMSPDGTVKGKLVMTKSWRKYPYPGGPFV